MLEVGDEEKFKSRNIADAPAPSGRVTEQLLDGQQRLTALWRSMHEKYLDRSYLVKFEDNPSDGSAKLPRVYGQTRWSKNGDRYPKWVDSPRECWQRRVIPIRLLRPDDIRAEIDDWIERAISSDSKSDFEKYKKYKIIDHIISDLRTRVREFNLPYLALPVETPRDVALDVFVKMNTSSMRLSTYDVVVALVEEKTGESLHEHVGTLGEKVVRASEYASLSNSLVLDVVALMQDRTPVQAEHLQMDYVKMIEEWEMVVKSVAWMVDFLEAEAIFDSQRLPTYAAIPIIAALREHLPTQPDRRGNARHLLRKFLWRAFLTSRYEKGTRTKAIQDFRGLKKCIRDGAGEEVVPIFDVDSYPLPTQATIRQAGWPKRKTILGRGLLALQIKCGAVDLADGTRALPATIACEEHPREYHHLFPRSTLTDAGIPDEEVFLALNCALITKRTNRTISDKDPLVYLKERIDNSVFGKGELRRRLKTHLIPYNELDVGYERLKDEERRAKVKVDYGSVSGFQSEHSGKCGGTSM